MIMGFLEKAQGYFCGVFFKKNRLKYEPRKNKIYLK